MTQPPTTITARLALLRADGSEWGRENISITKHANGSTFRSCMEMDDLGIFRDSNFSMSNEWKPIEGFTRDTVNGTTEGHFWYRLDGIVAEIEGYSLEKGRISQRLEADAEIGHLGLHVILSDCMVSAARGCNRPGEEHAVTCVANSLDGYGRGAAEGFFVKPLVTYVGCEELTVLAGTFEAEHFKVRWSDVVPNYSDFWILKPYFLPLKMLGASNPVIYELAELKL